MILVVVVVTLIYCQHELVFKIILITINLRTFFLPNNHLKDEPRLQPLLATVHSRVMIPILTSSYCQSKILIKSFCFGFVPPRCTGFIQMECFAQNCDDVVISYASTHFKRSVMGNYNVYYILSRIFKALPISPADKHGARFSSISRGFHCQAAKDCC